jgi:hypothetical protein
MSRVSYFARFAAREDQLTNNTMLLLRHLHMAGGGKLETVLGGVLDGQQIEIGLSFEQQAKLSRSRPDATITQAPLRIHFEAKLGDAFGADQIERHAAGIAASSDGARNTYLIGLTRDAIAPAEFEALEAAARNHGVMFAATTFTEIAEAAQDSCADHETAILDIVTDYRAFLADSGMLTDRGRTLVVFPCGTSLDDNARLKVYFEPASRPSKAGYRFIGLYRNKAVQFVGEPSAVFACRTQGGDIVEVTEPTKGASEEALTRIRAIITEISYYGLGDDFTRYYLFDELHPTSFAKSSKHGLLNLRYLDIGAKVPTLKSLSASDLATALNGKTFE